MKILVKRPKPLALACALAACSVDDKGTPFYNVEPKGNVLKLGDTLGVLLYLYKEPR